MFFEIYAKKDLGEKCWGWRIQADGNIVAECKDFNTKDQNQDIIKKILTGACSIKDDLHIDIDSRYLEVIADAEVKYECLEDDPAHKEKGDDTTETRGFAGS